MTHRKWTGVAMLGLFMLCGAALAQDSGKGIVSGSGQATIKAQPDLVRVTIELNGQGKDIKEALAKLSVEREEAKVKLESLGIASDGVQFSDATIGAVGGESDARAMAMAMMRGNRRTAATPTSQVKVAAKLEASLPLKGASPQDKLVEAVELMDKARAAFARKLTPEEQEIAEEMQGQMPGQTRPGEPQFLFVHVITEAERAKATADAMAQAKQSATRLAQAAGLKLGQIRQLSESASNGASTNDDMNNSYYRMVSMAGQGAAPASGEAISTQPGLVTFVVNVSIGYALE